MKNIKLLIIAALFSSLLTGCGMKGPLYHPPAEQPANEEKVSAEQDNVISTTTENPDSSSENTAEEELNKGFENTTENISK